MRPLVWPASLPGSVWVEGAAPWRPGPVTGRLQWGWPLKLTRGAGEGRQESIPKPPVLCPPSLRVWSPQDPPVIVRSTWGQRRGKGKRRGRKGVRNRVCRDFPGDPVGKAPSSRCRGPGFRPWLGK